MGASTSRDNEFEEALNKFNEQEQSKLNELFDSLSLSSETLLSKVTFKNSTLNYFPALYCERLFDFIKQCSNNNTEAGQADKREFLFGISQILRGTLKQKAAAFYFLASKDNKITVENLTELCFALTEGYIIAIKNSGSGDAYMHKKNYANTEDKRLAEMLVNSIPEECRSRDVTADDVGRWMNEQVLLCRVFEDVCKACFLGIDSIVETHWHGVKQGCEPTVEHVERKKDILLPCKLDFQSHRIETLLDISSMLMLNHAIPSECRHIWRLLYATSSHGKSFTTFLHRIVYQGPTILVVKDREGAVFGGFASTSWKVKSCFTGDTNCFLFTLQPSMSIYHPTGINENYIYLNVGMQTIPNGLGMGGQFEYFGLWLDHEFGPGHSKARPKCTTYGSPQLSASEDFQIEEIEVWGVGAPPEQEEKQRSVLDTETDAQAILDLIGKERKSEGFREPEDSD